MSTLKHLVVAEHLGDLGCIRSFGALLDEVLQEAMDFLVETVNVIILVVGELLRDHVVIALQELVALLFTCLFVLKCVGVVLVMHLLLQIGQEFVSYFSDGCLLEEDHGFFLRHFVDTSQFFGHHWAAICEFFIEATFEDLECVTHGVLAFVPADVGPGRLDAWHCTSID